MKKITALLMIFFLLTSCAMFDRGPDLVQRSATLSEEFFIAKETAEKYYKYMKPDQQNAVRMVLADFVLIQKDIQAFSLKDSYTDEDVQLARKVYLRIKNGYGKLYAAYIQPAIWDKVSEGDKKAFGIWHRSLVAMDKDVVAYFEQDEVNTKTIETLAVIAITIMKMAKLGFKIYEKYEG